MCRDHQRDADSMIVDGLEPREPVELREHRHRRSGVEAQERVRAGRVVDRTRREEDIEDLIPHIFRTLLVEAPVRSSTALSRSTPRGGRSCPTCRSGTRGSPRESTSGSPRAPLQQGSRTRRLSRLRRGREHSQAHARERLSAVSARSTCDMSRRVPESERIHPTSSLPRCQLTGRNAAPAFDVAIPASMISKPFGSMTATGSSCDHTVVDHHVSKRTGPAIEVSVSEALPSDEDGRLCGVDDCLWVYESEHWESGHRFTVLRQDLRTVEVGRLSAQ